MIFLLIIFLFLILISIYLIERDIITPSFILTFVFFVAAVNLTTNIDIYQVYLSMETFSIVLGGVVSFCFGAMSVRKIYMKKSKVSKTKRLSLSRPNSIILFLMIIFNVFAVLYVLREVYLMTVERAHYSGGIIGSLSVYAEVSKFSNIDMKISKISTLLTAICEAESFVFVYYFSYCLVHKIKISILEIVAFIAAFTITFCQGSRGGVFIILTGIICYIIVYREVIGKKMIPLKTIVRFLFFFLMAIVIFQISGYVTGKMWKISMYEYISVYLGDPLINLDIAIQNGFESSPFAGYLTFRPIFDHVFVKLGLELPIYNEFSQFQFINGHNIGNVYTLFSTFLGDFGFVGIFPTLFMLGVICQIVYNNAIKCTNKINVIQIIYSFLAVCIGFSFFSNKISENFTIYHVYMFTFVYLFIRFVFSKKSQLMNKIYESNNHGQ